MKSSVKKIGVLSLLALSIVFTSCRKGKNLERNVTYQFLEYEPLHLSLKNSEFFEGESPYWLKLEFQEELKTYFGQNNLSLGSQPEYYIDVSDFIINGDQSFHEIYDDCGDYHFLTSESFDARLIVDLYDSNLNHLTSFEASLDRSDQLKRKTNECRSPKINEHNISSGDLKRILSKKIRKKVTKYLNRRI